MLTPGYVGGGPASWMPPVMPVLHLPVAQLAGAGGLPGPPRPQQQQQQAPPKFNDPFGDLI